MNHTKDRHQGTKMSNSRCCLTIVHSLLLIFLWSGQAMAAQSCKTTSITASTPTAQFKVHANGTVTDLKTGLMWKVCSEGQTWSSTTAAGVATCTANAASFYNWQGALKQAKSVNTSGFAGKKDWRVPNIKELDSIVEMQCSTPFINAAIFPATPSAQYWSSSPDAGNASYAWFVYFNYGSDSAYSKTYGSSHVRLVRGGQ